MKQCSRCQKVKSKDEFYRRKTASDGLNPECKICKKQAEKQMYKQNKTKRLLQMTEYREKNRDALLRAQRESYKKNAKSRVKKQSEYEKRRLLSDPLFRLKKNLRARLNVALRNRQKVGSAIQDLGCSIEDFRRYLESKFEPGMTWDNYGQWHIDHIVPLASFDLTKHDDLLKAVHFSNLQPLWAEDNFSKSNRIA